MLSITDCKKIVNREGIRYSDEEIETIREVLYQVAKICHIKNIKKNENEENGSITEGLTIR